MAHPKAAIFFNKGAYMCSRKRGYVPISEALLGPIVCKVCVQTNGHTYPCESGADWMITPSHFSLWRSVFWPIVYNVFESFEDNAA